MNRRRISIQTLVVAVALCVGAGTALGQTSNEGSVRGYVKDAQGAVLPGVTIRATSDASPIEHSGISDATGYYRLDNLLPGTYALTADLQGFSKYKRDGIDVRAGLNLGLEIVLTVGAVERGGRGEGRHADARGDQLGAGGQHQRRVPAGGANQSERRIWSDALSMAPGMISAEGGFAGTGGYYFLRGADRSSR